MEFEREAVAEKLRRWDNYLQEYRLPAWESIPDLGLYMEQVVTLLAQYLDYLPPELKEDQIITAAAINNYVRKKIIPEPVKKRYYRRHLAYLIIVCTLKQCLNIPMLSALIPPDLSEEEIRRIYESYAERHHLASEAFLSLIREAAGRILGSELPSPFAAEKPEDLITTAAVIGGFSRILAQKLLMPEEKKETEK